MPGAADSRRLAVHRACEHPRRFMWGRFLPSGLVPTLSPGGRVMAGALGTVTTLAKETVTRWTEDKASALAAALAYYSLFSLAPLVLIAVAVAGLAFGQQAAEGQLYSQLAGLRGDATAKALQGMVANMHQQEGGGIVATIVGIATLLFGASGVFAQLQDSMNTIWKARSPTTNGIVDFLRVRMLSFSMVLGIGFLLLVSLLPSPLLAPLPPHPPP